MRINGYRSIHAYDAQSALTMIRDHKFD
ncbi:MAG: hypothetical protein ACPL3P_06990, partial [Anaerolineales bacterium]